MRQTETNPPTNGSGKAFSPPYGSFTTVNNLFERMADEGGVPARIDRSYLTNLPGSVQSTTMQALKSLELVDDNLHPTPLLIDIVEKPNERKSLLAGVIRDKYAPQLALGNRATTAQLEASLREAGIQGSTLRKAIAFFITAARWADVPISPYFKTPRAPASDRPKRRSEPAPEPLPVTPPVVPPAAPDPFKDVDPFILGLVRALPPPNSVFPTEKQKAWLDTAQNVFKLLYKTGEEQPEFVPAGGGADSD